MQTVIHLLPVGLLINAAFFVVGVVFSTKIKDWWKGIPSDLRSDLSALESKVTMTAKAASAAAVAKVVATVPAAPAGPTGATGAAA